jgi:branched-chain amino acid transport system substrate-binding protein
MPKAKTALLAAMVVVLSVCASRAEKQYDPGASDTSIKIGNTLPYSGPVPLSGASLTTRIEVLGSITNKIVDSTHRK